jgi:exopolysaccharide biosynthesis polyprenyl glycosylphosphotransferase
VAAPVSPDPRDAAPLLDDVSAREIRDPRSETGVSTRRLRHLIGRGLDVLMLLAIDVFGITAAIFSGLVLREVLGSRPVYEDQLWAAERAWLPFVLLVSVLIFTRNGLYRPRETRPGGAQIVAGLFVAVVVIAIFSVVTDNERFTTYLIFPYTFVASAILIPLLRGLYSWLINATAKLIGIERRVLVVGEPDATRSVEAALRAGAPGAGLRTVAHVDDIDHLEAAISEHHPHDVVLARPPDDETMLIALEACRERRIRLRVVPTAAGVLAHHADYVPGLAVPLFDIVPPTIQGVDWFVKRAFDLLISTTLLLLLSPLLLISIVMIRLTSPGPILFRDQRVGLGEQPFAMLKLRSMVTNAAQAQAELEEQNEADGALFKIRNDPRVTPVGRVLRRFSIDELPQLLNVIKGEMSLVGPRPLPMRDYQLLEQWHRRRYSVLPGITGLWQVSGRSNLGFDTLVRLDFYYLESWTIWMDIAIIARTPLAIMRGRGAY